MTTPHAHKIATARHARGLTQAALAEAVGTSPAMIAHWEAGRRAPSLDSLERLAEALGVTVRKLGGCPTCGR